MSFLPSTRLFCSRGAYRRTYFDRDRPDEIEIRRLANALTNEPTGIGPATGQQLYLMGGFKKRDSSRIATKVSTRVYCCNSRLGSPTTRYRLRAITPFVRPISRRKFTIVNCFIPARSSHISSRIFGSTFAIFVTNSCAPTTATSSRFAGKRHLCSKDMPSAIRWNSSAMTNTVGDSQRATGLVG